MMEVISIEVEKGCAYVFGVAVRGVRRGGGGLCACGFVFRLRFIVAGSDFNWGRN